MKFNYHWSMPNKETFKIKPINQYLKNISKNSPSCGIISIDPFARRKHEFALITEDDAIPSPKIKSEITKIQTYLSLSFVFSYL